MAKYDNNGSFWDGMKDILDRGLSKKDAVIFCRALIVVMGIAAAISFIMVFKK